jgi:hypothetical protein
LQVIQENCTTIEAAPTPGDADLYMTCSDKQYTAGMELAEDGDVSIWTLLCCDSASVVVRTLECATTAFLNHDTKEHFNYSSGTQIIRKWNSLVKEDDE